jgi:hypothetical protein
MKGRDHLGDIGICGRIYIRMDLKERVWTGFI